MKFRICPESLGLFLLCLFIEEMAQGDPDSRTLLQSFGLDSDDRFLSIAFGISSHIDYAFFSAGSLWSGTTVVETKIDVDCGNFGCGHSHCGWHLGHYHRAI